MKSENNEVCELSRITQNTHQKIFAWHICLKSVSFWQLFQYFSVFPSSNKVVLFQQTENHNQKAIISKLVIHPHVPSVRDGVMGLTSLEENTV